MGYSGPHPGRASRDDVRGAEGSSRAFRTGADGSEISFELAAADLHASNRRRAELFNHPVMADKVMDIMLAALIAHEQQTVLTRMAAAMANRLGLSEAEKIMDELISARLLEASKGDRVALTPLGADLMRDYVRRTCEAAALPK